MEQAADECRRLGVDDVRTEITYGAAAVEVLDLTRPGDLVVVGTHGHRAIARMLLGSTSSALVVLSHHPVLVVRSGAAATDARVVVGVDGSLSSTSTLRAAAQEAERHGVVLRAITAVPDLVDSEGVPVSPTAGELDEAEAVLAEAVAGVREDYPDLVVERVVSRIHPVVALTMASQTARLVVVGSRGREIRSILLGSVSRSVVQHAHCSVLVVHPGRDPGTSP